MVERASLGSLQVGFAGTLAQELVDMDIIRSQLETVHIRPLRNNSQLADTVVAGIVRSGGW